jgi:hypothetical protein
VDFAITPLRALSLTAALVHWFYLLAGQQVHPDTIRFLRNSMRIEGVVMRKLIGFVFAGLLLTTAVAAKADVFTYTSPGVDYATSTSAGFAVNSIGEYSGTTMAISQGGYFVEIASGSAYSDAGIVLYFNGGLTLGQLQGVTVDSIQSPVNVNLYLDTGGDGQFFSFSSGLMTSLNGDSYASDSGGVLPVTESSDFYMQAGDGAGWYLHAGAASGRRRCGHQREYADRLVDRHYQSWRRQRPGVHLRSDRQPDPRAVEPDAAGHGVPGSGGGDAAQAEIEHAGKQSRTSAPAMERSFCVCCGR